MNNKTVASACCTTTKDVFVSEYIWQDRSVHCNSSDHKAKMTIYFKNTVPVCMYGRHGNDIHYIVDPFSVGAVFIRQNLTSEVDSRTERIKYL